MMTDATLLIGGGTLASALMTLVWLIQYRYGDAGIVDVAWGLGVAILAILFLWLGGTGPAERRIVAAILISLWAMRLGGYVALRLWNSSSEDGRYRDLKAQWGAAAQTKLFRFYQLQAFGCWLFALPLWLVGKNESLWNLSDYAAIVIWVLAILGETMSDAQLAAFRSNPANQGQVCRNGWWRFSRHPNYFFEWLHWWTYVLFAWPAPWGWLTLLGPAAMGYFIWYVTGIPPTEAQALRSRGEAYREYQRTTSPFFPWWPKD